MEINFFKNSDKRFDDVMKIRNEVFIEEQGVNSEEETDEYDLSGATLYALITDNGVPVATGRTAITPDGFKIGRIAVVKTARGNNTGATLVKALCKNATESGAAYILVDAQLHAVGFYEKLGFKKTGEKIIIDRGIEHLPMRKTNE